MAQETSSVVDKGRAHDTTDLESNSRARILHRMGYYDMAKGESKFHREICIDLQILTMAAQREFTLHYGDLDTTLNQAPVS